MTHFDFSVSPVKMCLANTSLKKKMCFLLCFQFYLIPDTFLCDLPKKLSFHSCKSLIVRKSFQYLPLGQANIPLRQANIPLLSMRRELCPLLQRTQQIASENKME